MYRIAIVARWCYLANKISGSDDQKIAIIEVYTGSVGFGYKIELVSSCNNAENPFCGKAFYNLYDCRTLENIKRNANKWVPEDTKLSKFLDLIKRLQNVKTMSCLLLGVVNEF